MEIYVKTIKKHVTPFNINLFVTKHYKNKIEKKYLPYIVLHMFPSLRFIQHSSHVLRSHLRITDLYIYIFPFY